MLHWVKKTHPMRTSLLLPSSWSVLSLNRERSTYPLPFLLQMQSSFTHTRTAVFHSSPSNTHQLFISLLAPSWQHTHVLAVPTSSFTYYPMSLIPFRVYLEKFAHIHCLYYLSSILSLIFHLPSIPVCLSNFFGRVYHGFHVAKCHPHILFLIWFDLWMVDYSLLLETLCHIGCIPFL